VRVDALSARLLGPHFALTSSPEGAILIGEEREADVSRPLLGKPTPCVGREAELSSLEGLFTGCVEESEARAVLVTAPPGAGKSRLRHELLRRIERRGEPVTILAGRGDAMSAGAPYGVLAAAIRALAEVGSDAAPEEQRCLLRSRVGQHVAEADHERVVRFIGELCDVPFPDEGMPMLRAARHEPKIMGDCLRRAVLDFLAAECGAGPVLIVLDDLQWGDALTVSALDDALREQAGAPLLVLALARPEIHEAFPRLWTGHEVQEIALRGLSRKACERLIREVLGKDVPRAVINRAIEQSAGNALFLEEIIRAIAEGRGEGQPETVVAMLQARMGRLAAAPRRALHAASVFGQTFWSGGVARVLAAAPADVTGWLSALIEAELVQPSPASRLLGEKEHAFRHALVRDAAYGLLTASDITTGHRLAGEFLEAAGEHDAALVAEQFERGGEAARAAGWYRRAAEQALEANDLTAVIAHARRAAGLGAEGEVLGATLVYRGEAHVWRGDLAEAMACLEEALRLVPGGSPLYFRTVTALGWAASNTGDLQQLLALAADLRGALEGSPSVPALVAAAKITSRFWNYPELDREVAPFMALLTPRLADPGCDPVVIAYVGQLAAWQAFRDGDPTMACRPLELCAERFEGIGDAREAARARLNFGTYANILGQIDLAEAALRSSVAFFERVGMHGVVASARAHLSLTLLYRGATDEARALGELAVAALASSGNVRGEEHARSRLAAVLTRTGDLSAAELEASRAVQLSETVPAWRCLALATLAQVLLVRARPVEALRAAREAVEHLDRQEAPDEGEPLARLTLAEALHASGDPDGARAAIASARAHLLAWAAKIGDPAWRESFLANIPENARTLALAAEWGAG
jgi:tetratricopeptide (TPR) repeat protein